MSDDNNSGTDFGIEFEFDNSELPPANTAHAANADDEEFGMDFEFDTDGMEPGLELDLSGIEPKAEQPAEPPPPEPGLNPAMGAPAEHNQPGYGPPQQGHHGQPGAAPPGMAHMGAPGAPHGAPQTPHGAGPGPAAPSGALQPGPHGHGAPHGAAQPGAPQPGGPHPQHPQPGGPHPPHPQPGGSHPQHPQPGGPAHGPHPGGPHGPQPGGPGAQGQRPRPAGPRPMPPPSTGGSSMFGMLAIGAVVLLIALVGLTMLGGDSQPSAGPAPQQALEEGEMAYHQGKWIDALTAFKRLRRFPGSPQAVELQKRGWRRKHSSRSWRRSHRRPTSSDSRSCLRCIRSALRCARALAKFERRCRRVLVVPRSLRQTLSSAAGPRPLYGSSYPMSASIARSRRVGSYLTPCGLPVAMSGIRPSTRT